MSERLASTVPVFNWLSLWRMGCQSHPRDAFTVSSWLLPTPSLPSHATDCSGCFMDCKRHVPPRAAPDGRLQDFIRREYDNTNEIYFEWIAYFQPNILRKQCLSVFLREACRFLDQFRFSLTRNIVAAGNSDPSEPPLNRQLDCTTARTRSLSFIRTSATSLPGLGFGAADEMGDPQRSASSRSGPHDRPLPLPRSATTADAAARQTAIRRAKMHATTGLVPSVADAAANVRWGVTTHAAPMPPSDAVPCTPPTHTGP